MACVTFRAEFFRLVLNINIEMQSCSKCFAFIGRFLYVCQILSHLAKMLC